MTRLFGKTYTREVLASRVGSLAQVGGVELVEVADGPARGVRLLEFRLGSGFTFKVALERGMDVGACEYKGVPLGWIPPTRLPGPWYFEQQTEFGWLRTAMGGFCTSCGMLHIGNPESDSIAQYNFPARQEERYGVHDRLAMLPARLSHYGEAWEGDECVLSAEGEITQAQVYGENLSLRRRYTARLGDKAYRMTDTVINAGHYPTPLMLLYHFNIGFPLVDEGSELVAEMVHPPVSAREYARFTSPQPGSALQVFEHALQTDADGFACAAIVNPGLGAGGMGVYVRYQPAQLPRFFQTRLMDRGHYFVCLEPSTNGFGRPQVRQAGELIVLEPGERRLFELEVGVVEGASEIAALTAHSETQQSG